MIRISITDLQREVGKISILIIRGEDIIITRNGKDFAKIKPVPFKDRIKVKGKKRRFLRGVEPIMPPYTVKNVEISSTPPSDAATEMAANALANTRICQAPNAKCLFPGELYQVEYTTDEGVDRKLIVLCPGHAMKARASATLKKL